MSTNRYMRHADLLSEDQRALGINVIGAGANGSFIVLALAKMGFTHIKVFDNDSVEEHNIPNQFYRLKDIGRPKVEALVDMVRDFEDIEIQGVNELYKGQPLIPGIVVSAVDSIKARQEIYKHILQNPAITFYIDTRMMLEFLEILTVDPTNEDSKKYYEDTIKDPKDVVHERCTAKTVMFTVLCAASFAGSIVTRYVRKEFDEIPRHVGMDLQSLQTVRLDR